MDNKSGYTYDNAIKVSGVPEEYQIVAATNCDGCNQTGYVKNQGPDPHSRFVKDKFFDVIHCECKYCNHRRDFVFDISEIPRFKDMILIAKSQGPDVLENIGNRYNKEKRQGFSIELSAPTEPPIKDNMQVLPKYIPLIFALKDLRIQYYPNQINSHAEFSRTACLIRGDAVLEMPDDTMINSVLRNEQLEPLPPDPLFSLMLKDLSDWPEDTCIAVRGIFAFGPGDVVLAKQCALHSFKLNNQCTLAKQLFQLLSEKIDPRVPFGK